MPLESERYQLRTKKQPLASKDYYDDIHAAGFFKGPCFSFSVLHCVAVPTLKLVGIRLTQKKSFVRGHSGLKACFPSIIHVMFHCFLFVFWYRGSNSEPRA